MKDSKHKEWSALQDTLLIQAVSTHKDRWQFVSTAVPGRTALECEARYSALQKLGVSCPATLQKYQTDYQTDKPNVRKKFIPKPSLFAHVNDLPAPIPKILGRRNQATALLKENKNSTIPPLPPSYQSKRPPLQPKLGLDSPIPHTRDIPIVNRHAFSDSTLLHSKQFNQDELMNSLYTPKMENKLLPPQEMSSTLCNKKWDLDSLFSPDPSTPMNFIVSEKDEEDEDPRIKDLKWETRHEYSCVEIPRSEVEDLFNENAEAMAKEEMELLYPQKFNAEPLWLHTKKEKISVDQLEIIKIQLKSLFQLNVQSYCIQKGLKGPDHSETLYWKSQLQHHQEWAQFGQKQGSTLNNIFNIPGIELLPLVYEFQDDPQSKTLLDFKREYPLGLKPKIKAQILGPNTPQKQKNGLALPESIKSSFKLLDPYLDSKLHPVIIPLIRSLIADWSVDENTLLLNGLLQYGPTDVASIRAHYLPTKSLNQLKIRLKNSKYRRATVDNRIKTYFLQPFKPLLLYEREIIIQGLKTHGKKFRLMVKTLFKYTPLAFLKEVWDQLYITREIEHEWLDSKPRAKTCKVKSNPLPPVLHPSLYKIPIPRQGLVQPPLQDGIQMIPSTLNANLLLEDTGSVYQPSSEWDMTHFIDLDHADDHQETLNYDEFLNTIFEDKDGEEVCTKQQDQLEEDVKEEHCRPKISLSGAYDCQSSDQEDGQDSLDTLNQKKSFMEDFFDFSRDSADSVLVTSFFVSPEKKMTTRSSSRISTANNSVQKKANAKNTKRKSNSSSPTKRKSSARCTPDKKKLKSSMDKNICRKLRGSKE